MDTREIEFTDVYSLVQPDKFDHSNVFNRNYALEYGLGSCLLEYVGFEKNYKLKAFFEHGISFSDATETSMRVHESLPTITSSDFRKNVILSHKNNNGAYSIGPYIAYAKSLLSKKEIIDEKERLGKNLLVFPAHSTNLLNASFNIEDFCKRILEKGKDFDSIRICLYWKDVVNGYKEIYEKYGFEVVTAGYINDQYFLNRLRSIIETADVTMSNELGSHMGFCIYLNKPHYFIKTDELTYDLTSESTQSKIRNKEEDGTDNHVELDYMKTLLSQQDADYDDLMPIIEKYFGLNNVKSKEELKNIFMECENNYSSMKFYLGFFKLAKLYFNHLLNYFR